MNKVYLIKGCFGIYGDRNVWDVGVILQERDADEFVQLLNNWLAERGRHESQLEEFDYSIVEEKCDLDSKLPAHSYGVDYYYVPVDVVGVTNT